MAAMIIIFILSMIVPSVIDKRISQPGGYILMGVSISIPMIMVFVQSIKKLKELKGDKDEQSKRVRRIQKITLVIVSIFFAIFLITPTMGIVALIQGPKTITVMNPVLTSSVSGGRHRVRRYYIEGRKKFGSQREKIGLGSGHDIAEIKKLLEEYNEIEIEYYEAIESSCSIKGIK